MFSSEFSSKGFKGSDGKSSDKRPVVLLLCLVNVHAVLSELSPSGSGLCPQQAPAGAVRGPLRD